MALKEICVDAGLLWHHEKKARCEGHKWGDKTQTIDFVAAEFHPGKFWGYLRFDHSLEG